MALLCLGAASAWGQDSARVVLRWKPVQSAVSYELEISRGLDFKQPVLKQTVAQAGYRWNELPEVAYYWRVRSIDGEGRRGDWSPPERIEAAVGAPQQARPADAAEVVLEDARGIELSAARAALLREYIFQVARAPDFAAGVVERRGPAPTARVPLPAAGHYFWRVVGVDLKGRTTAPSAARSFVLVPPAPRPPERAERWQIPFSQPPPTLELRWNGAALASSYEVALERDEAAVSTSPSGGPVLAVTLEAVGTYRWRVRALGEQEAKGPWSTWSAVEVVLPAPSLKVPVDRATLAVRTDLIPVELAWSPSAGATGYRVELTADPSFEKDIVTSTVVAPTLHLDNVLPGTHSWRVTAMDGSSHASAPSEVRGFTAVRLPPLKAPSVLAPLDRVVVPRGADATLELSWESVEGAARYELQVGPPVNLSSAEVERVTEPRAQRRGLSEGPLAFRARALDADGVAGPWGQPASFYFGLPPTAKMEISPERTTLTVGGTEDTWVRVRLLDEEGRPVRGAPLEVQCDAGQLGLVTPDGDGYRVHYLSPKKRPPSGTAVLSVRDRGTQGRAQLTLAARPARFEAGARVGWNSNFGSISSPWVGVELTYRSGWLDQRLFATARASLYGAGADVPAESGLPAPLATSARIAPLALLLGYQLPLEPYAVYAAAGPAVFLTRVVVGPSSESGAAPGALALVGASRSFGPGRASLEAGYAWGEFDGAVAHFRTGGLFAAVGYAFSP